MRSIFSSTLRRFGFIAVFFTGSLLFSTGVEAADRTVTWPPAVVNVPYTYLFTSEAGFPEPYVWEVSTSTVSDVLPAGLTGSRAGAREIKVYGTPRQVGVYQFTIAPRALDRTLLPTTLVTLEVLAEPLLPRIVNGAGSRTGSMGVMFSSEPILSVQHGVAPYVWRFVSGGLPSGLTFTTRGAIEGTATVAGTYLFQAEVLDGAGFRATTSVTVTVAQRMNGTSNGGSVALPVSSPAIPVSSMSHADRLNLLNRLGANVNTVVRTDYLDPLMLRPLHYYVGADGRRHIFQSDAVYYSWYPSVTTETPRVMNIQDVTSIPMGEPVTYRPGERVRFRTDAQTYAVVDARVIQPTTDQGADASMWQRGVEELDETYFTMYRSLAHGMSTDVPTAIRARYLTPNQVLPLSTN